MSNRRRRRRRRRQRGKGIGDLPFGSYGGIIKAAIKRKPVEYLKKEAIKFVESGKAYDYLKSKYKTWKSKRKAKKIGHKLSAIGQNTARQIRMLNRM